MTLSRWQIVFLRESEQDSTGHPAVILSHEDLLNNPKALRINVLMGTQKQPAERAGSHHVILDETDGLDFLTLIDCSMIYVARKSSILRSTGSTTVHRRQEMQRKVRAFLGLG